MTKFRQLPSENWRLDLSDTACVIYYPAPNRALPAVFTYPQEIAEIFKMLDVFEETVLYWENDTYSLRGDFRKQYETAAQKFECDPEALFYAVYCLNSELHDAQ